MSFFPPALYFTWLKNEDFFSYGGDDDDKVLKLNSQIVSNTRRAPNEKAQGATFDKYFVVNSDSEGLKGKNFTLT